MTRPGTVPFARLATVPAGAAAGWLLAALVLLLADAYTPLGWLLLCAPAAAAGGVLGWQATTASRWPATAAAAAALVAVATTALAWSTASPQAVLRRDPGSYLLTTTWLAQHGSLRIPSQRAVFGDADVTTASPGYYERGDTIVPQFMSGWPSLAAPAERLAGMGAVPPADAVLAGLAVLAVAAIGGRVAGPWPGVLAAALLAAAMPLQHVARDGLSEPGALLLLAAGVGLLVDARARADAATAADPAAPTRSGPDRAWFLGGLLAGLSTLVRIDSIADVLLLAPWAAWRWRAGGRPLAAGLAVGVGAGVVDGLVLTAPYLRMLRGQLIALAAAAVVLTAGTVAARRSERARRAVGGLVTRFPALFGGRGAAGAVLAVTALLAARPLVLEVHQSGLPRNIAGMQHTEGIPIEPTRTYAEQSVWWLVHWTGLPAALLALGGVAAAAAAIRAGRRRELAALLLVGLPATALVLYKPGITPDHPWADRRLVPVALPLVAVAGAAAVRWTAARLTGRSRSAGVGLLVAAFVVPAAWAAAPLGAVGTEGGEIDAVRAVCRALPPDAAVLAVGNRARLELPPALRDACGVPVAVVPPGADSTSARTGTERAQASAAASAAVHAAAAAAAAHGRRLVVVSMEPAGLTDLGLTPRPAVRLETLQDPRLLIHVPDHAWTLPVEVYLAEPG